MARQIHVHFHDAAPKKMNDGIKTRTQWKEAVLKKYPNATFQSIFSGEKAVLPDGKIVGTYAGFGTGVVKNTKAKDASSEVPETAIKAALQKYGFTSRNLESLAAKMKTYQGKEIFVSGGKLLTKDSASCTCKHGAKDASLSKLIDDLIHGAGNPDLYSRYKSYCKTMKKNEENRNVANQFLDWLGKVHPEVLVEFI